MTTMRLRAVQRLRTGWGRQLARVSASGDRGSSTVEVTLLTPLLVMVLLFVVLCGRLVAVQIDLDAAASSGARSASLARTQTAARTEADRTARATLTARRV